MTDRRAADRRESNERRSSDRRDLPRFSADLTIRLLPAGNGPERVLDGQLQDASPTGLKFLVDQPLCEGDRLLIEVRPEPQLCFNLSAEVVWIETTSNGWFRIGSTLRPEMSARQHTALRRCLAHTT